MTRWTPCALGSTSGMSTGYWTRIFARFTMKSITSGCFVSCHIDWGPPADTSDPQMAEAGTIDCCGRRRNDGDFKIVRRTIKKRMRTTLAAIRETLMRRRHEPVAVVGRWLRQVLQGYLNYMRCRTI
jgi:hypothetical protein